MDGLMEDNLDLNYVKRVLETALLTTPEPLTLPDLKRLSKKIGEGNGAQGAGRFARGLGSRVRARVGCIRPCAFVRVRSFRSSIGFLQKPPPKYRGAVLETLAIMRSPPCTRVTMRRDRALRVSSTSKSLERVGSWDRVIGHREVPGRPGSSYYPRLYRDLICARSKSCRHSREDALAKPVRPRAGQATIDSGPVG